MRLHAFVALGLLTVACERAERGAPASSTRADGEVHIVSPTPVAPSGGYALGRAPTASEVSAWNTAIGPDGAALPPGRGTVAAGAALFRTHCASCHGQRGEGIAPVYPALIGRSPATDAFRFAEDPALVKTIGNYWPHATTLFDYLRRAMPLFTPGALSDDEYYALTAYLLAANQVIPDTTTLDAAALRAVQMPARGHFIPDDRSAGPRVR